MHLKIKTISYDTRVHTFWALIFLSVFCLALYVYGINSTVRNTVTRSILESDNANIAAHLGEMEFEYIALKNKVSLAVAYDRGFKDVSAPTYISRSSAKTLTLNTSR